MIDYCKQSPQLNSAIAYWCANDHRGLCQLQLQLTTSVAAVDKDHWAEYVLCSLRDWHVFCCAAEFVFGSLVDVYVCAYMCALTTTVHAAKWLNLNLTFCLRHEHLQSRPLCVLCLFVLCSKDTTISVHSVSLSTVLQQHFGSVSFHLCMSVVSPVNTCDTVHCSTSVALPVLCETVDSDNQ